MLSCSVIETVGAALLVRSESCYDSPQFHTIVIVFISAVIIL